MISKWSQAQIKWALLFFSEIKHSRTRKKGENSFTLEEPQNVLDSYCCLRLKLLHDWTIGFLGRYYNMEPKLTVLINKYNNNNNNNGIVIFHSYFWSFFSFF